MLGTAEEAAEPNVRGRLTVACSAALTLENTHCIAKAAMARTATSSNCCGTAETAPESALLQKRPRDSHARVMTTHNSERRPNGRARSTTSPLHTRSRWCGHMALKPACPCTPTTGSSAKWQTGSSSATQQQMRQTQFNLE